MKAQVQRAKINVQWQKLRGRAENFENDGEIQMLSSKTADSLPQQSNVNENT